MAQQEEEDIPAEEVAEYDDQQELIDAIKKQRSQSAYSATLLIDITPLNERQHRWSSEGQVHHPASVAGSSYGSQGKAAAAVRETAPALRWERTRVDWRIA